MKVCTLLRQQRLDPLVQILFVHARGHVAFLVDQIEPSQAVAVAVSLTLAWLIGTCAGNSGAFEQVPAQHSGPTIQEIQSMAQLVTERVNISDVIETRLAGKTGSIRALVVVKGNVLVSTDLSQAYFDAINETTRSVVLVLPEPRVCQAMVDHEQTRVFAVSETGL
jgi:hypothetical protein